MKPLVFHIRASNFYGGPERQIIGHILSSQEFDHMVVTFREGCKKNEFEAVCARKHVHVTSIPTAHAYQWVSVNRLRSLLKEKKPSLVCCHGYKPLILTFLAKRTNAIPIIAFSRGHTAENLKIRFFETIERQLCRRVQAVIAVSQGYADVLMRHGINPNRLTVACNAVEMKKFAPWITNKQHTRQKLGFADNDFLIATAGRLSPEKAQLDLLTAFSRLGNQERPVHLVVCGDGPMRVHLEHYAQRLGISNVHFLGHRTDLDALMPIFDLFVLPSLTEGLPNVLLEAAACRVPLVATRVGGVPEIITDGISGRLVEPGNVDQLTCAIEHCLADPVQTGRFAEAALQTVESDFDFAKQTRVLEGLYNRLLEQHAGN